MFKSISIKNYRSFGLNPASSAQQIRLGAMTVVVGTNSSGKSNIIRALSFATDPSVDTLSRSEFYIGIYSGRERKSRAIEIELKASIGKNAHRIYCLGQGTDSRGYTKEFEIDGTKYPVVSKASPPSAALVAAQAPFAVFVAPTIRDVDYLNSAMQLLPVATRSVVSQSTNGLRTALASKLAGVCKELKLPLNVGGVSVNPIFTLESLLSNVRLNFNVNDGVELPLANLGQGHISQAILKLAELRGGSAVTCIEEPEIHVHPSGIRGLVRTLRAAAAQQGQQVIVTTHSSEFINQLNFDELVCVKKVSQKSVVAQIDPKAVGFGAAKLAGLQHKIIRQDQRGVLFLSKSILLVEGAYDRLVIEALDRDGAIGLVGQDVTVVDMGGKLQLPDYHALLEELGRPHAVLVDSDMVFNKSAAGPIVAGPLEEALRKTSILKAPLSNPYLVSVSGKKPSAFRTEIAKMSGQVAPKGIALAAHGHHDISQAIKECVQLASAAQKLAGYRALGGSDPSPTPAAIDSFLSGKALSKKAPMVELVAAFDVAVFNRIVNQVKRAIRELA